ncbi:MAG: DUF6115 domain-containing protein [Bacillota bacterium]|uniref:Uncharacterized protein n=1 Tax=Virgibacillus salarius TaxID=447199 RepID=A0A941DSF0_9BACI|nr:MULTISPECIES: hypothetical protein [Bacillaceae]NAZ07561.1 hypothetical protein [Agaribacter marinus]MBR7794841.1 hypothetical protein [Virgibacillus salarius]MCC2249254.1 hypothetical protein [Virgibacillus sp. AGTR]MDY7043920.1 hypothetical protein [Virgibacillus sp. M23]QRZ17290.1 hypothetical protein JUJ52_16145 [Virgibacillus sp. AGTR]
MTSFLLIISFLLHIIAFAAIYQLLKQVRQPNQPNQISSEEINSLLDNYLEELKEENDRLINQLTTHRDRKSKEVSEASATQDSKRAGEIQQAHSEYEPEVHEDDQVEASLQARILHLYSKGLSITEIARQLNCGKTEAELIIKMAGKHA